MKKSLLFLIIVLTVIVLAFANVNSFTIKGSVMDDTGVPVSGALILIKGTKSVTTTNEDGKFSIEILNKNCILIISAIGYQDAEVKVSGQKELNITITRLTQNLSEAAVSSSLSRAALAPKIAGYRTGLYLERKDEENRKQSQDNWRYNNDFNREGYDRIVENRFLKTSDNPLSTFSIDVDAASYSNVRRMLNDNQLPPAGAVRIEEMINYFTYTYPQPAGNDPFSINTEIAACPWKEEHQIVSIGLQGKKIPTKNLPPSNLTFLIDVSGSMESEDKLPLVKASLKLLAEQLRAQDKVSIAVYAGNAGLVLPPTDGTDKAIIKQALDRLEAGGSTAGGEGIRLAYKIAKENFIRNGNNRVILCTDGDFNVGMSSDDELERLIEEERKSGIFLTVLGFGTGNYQDAKMQKLADKGNGNHAYIDNLTEAKKVLVSEFGGTLFTIAKDVKLQVEFNPAKVQAYRLIGYENRMLAKEDFNNDKKDAGELGSGHIVTALYEIIPAGIKSQELDPVDSLRYQKNLNQKPETKFNEELINIKLRFKQPGSDVSKLLQHPVIDQNKSITDASDNLRFVSAVAQFGMLLRKSDYKGTSTYEKTAQLAAKTLQNDAEGYRKEFIELVKKAQKLSKEVAAAPRPKGS